MTPEQEDILAVAEMAGKVKGFYNERQQLVRDNGDASIIPRNIPDPRQIISNAFRGQPGMPQMQSQHYYQPPNQQYPQENSLTAYGQQIPEVMPTQAPQLLPVPIGKNPDGSIIMGDASFAAPQIQQSQLNVGLQTTGFQLPQFGKPSIVHAANSSNLISNENLEILMKELKSMKKSINKLTKAFETAKLIPDEHITINIQQPVTEEDLENTD